MRTIEFKEVVRQVTTLANLGASSTIGAPTSQNFDAVSILVNRRATEAWNRYWWPDVMRVEKRQFRATYAAATTYGVGDQVLYWPTKKYYQCVKAATTGVAPANAAGVVTASNWAEALSSYSGSEWTATDTYTAGTIVYYGVDGLYYACHTNTTAGILPTNTSYFGVLTRFIRSIDCVSTGQTTIGDVKAVWPDDPRIYMNLMADIPFSQIEQDEFIVDSSLPAVYVEFRLRTPEFTGSTWSSTTAYSTGAQVYYDTEGDYFVALQSTTNNIPATGSAYWSRVEYPFDLGRCVAQMVLADIMDSRNQAEMAIKHRAIAEDMFAYEIDRYSQQRHNSRLNVLTR